MHDGHAAATGGPAYAARGSTGGVGAVEAPLVVQYAAQSFLSRAYPQIDAWFASRVEVAGDSRSAAAKALGEEIGRQVFERCYYAVEKFPAKVAAAAVGAGAWRPTVTYRATGLEPGWPEQEPFELRSADQFRPSGPPTLQSGAYAAAFAEVESLGRQLGGPRNAEETLIARFWEDGMQTSTPPGHWNAIALQETKDLPLARQLEIILVLNIALADAGLAAWDAKYRYGFWRPVTAIQEAADDGNPATAPNDRWHPYIETPVFPEYVSGHSTFSAAAAAVLTHYLGVYAITIGTESMVGGVRRAFPTFEAAAEEAGRSRIYGGIHFEFSNRDGQKLGRDVGEFVLKRFSPPDMGS
jgi:hypothetical protein